MQWQRYAIERTGHQHRVVPIRKAACVSLAPGVGMLAQDDADRRHRACACECEVSRSRSAPPSPSPSPSPSLLPQRARGWGAARRRRRRRRRRQQHSQELRELHGGQVRPERSGGLGADGGEEVVAVHQDVDLPERRGRGAPRLRVRPPPVGISIESMARMRYVCLVAAMSSIRQQRRDTHPRVEQRREVGVAAVVDLDGDPGHDGDAGVVKHVQERHLRRRDPTVASWGVRRCCIRPAPPQDRGRACASKRCAQALRWERRWRRGRRQ
jgi:hypothetical protein